MIHSMTGFGEAQCHEGDAAFRVEIRSLNNRYYKSTLKLSEPFQVFESEIDKLLRARLGRGSILYHLRVRDESPSAAHEINVAALSKYVEQLGRVTNSHGVNQIDLTNLLELPGVCQPPEIDENRLAAHFSRVRDLTERAIEQLVQMRRVEGEALRRDLLAQCIEIREQLAQIRGRSPSVVREYHERLKARVQELIREAKLKLDEDALAREVAIFAERCDVNEEISRLSSHLDQFSELCDAPEESGRKLDFLSQEMLREANTIGSKANDSQIARRIVEIKACIDRIKEQVQNVE